MGKKRGRRKKLKLDFSLHPETRKGIFTLLLFVMGLLVTLSIFGVAGTFGASVDGFVSHIFGWDKLFVPVVLFAWGYHLMNPDKLPLKVTNFVGFALFFLGLNGLVHTATFANTGSVVDADMLGSAGGTLGQLVADPASSILGFAGAVVVFLAIFVTSIMLIFNTSLQTVVNTLMMVWNGIVKVLMVITAPFRWLFRKKEPKPVEEDFSASRDLDVEVEPEEEEDEAPAHPHAVTSSNASQQPLPIPQQKKHRRRVKIPIPVDLLARRDEKPTSGDIEFNKELIRRTLKQFGIEVEMADVSVGPTVTQFTFKPAEGVKLTRITALHNDLALALAAHPIRIEAPIPGKSLVGIEIPNKSVALVGLRELFESKAYQERERKMAIPFALGKDVAGMTSAVDLAKLPHTLVAGATGAGKSVCLNILITCLLYGHSPDDLKLVLVDPKRVEFTIYNGIPHLITPVVTKTEDTVNALKWTVREMDRRFDVLSAFGARDIASYNERSKERMPYLVFIVDELADLMVTSGAEVEGPIVRLAQMARAVGIHLVLATQRPSVDVLTGLIKANIPARIAFSVASATDSRTILDQAGADKLLGRGDMLYQTSDMPAPKRVQGAFISDDEVRRVVEFLKSTYGPPEYETGVLEAPRSRTAFNNGGMPIDDESDPQLENAMEEIIRAGKASASLLQRRLKVGYARAARLLDLLEQEGMIGPGDGAKPREILRTKFARDVEQIPTPASVEPVGRDSDEGFDEPSADDEPIDIEEPEEVMAEHDSDSADDKDSV